MIERQAAIDAAALSAAEWDGMYVQDINGRIRKALEKLPSAQPEAPCYLGSPCEYQNPNAEIQEECKLDGTTAVAKSKRTFVELLVHYPHPDVCTYPEYKGKPYYSIKYIEDGECFVGFGTYKPEVLSQYLSDYFMPPAQPEQKTALWIIRKWGDNAKCSNCGHTFNDVYDMDNHDRFCRFCGCKMIGVKGTNDK
mgnify:CR=1 FL=1